MGVHPVDAGDGAGAQESHDHLGDKEIWQAQRGYF
jgi:hypothetical protein